MRALSERQARLCENATQPRCKCRCRGAAHGKARLTPDAPRAEFEALPEGDPHKLPKKRLPFWQRQGDLFDGYREQGT